MKLAIIATLVFVTAFTPAFAGVPSLDHVIVVIMENHSYDQVLEQPYTAQLIAQNTLLTNSYAITHPSFPNYLALWAGSTLGVTTNDCPPGGTPWSVENLGHTIEQAGMTWRAYSEDLPSVGYTGCSSDAYHRRHAPWPNFSNLDHSNERPYTDLALDIAAGTLPALAFVVPNNCDNTHDCAIATGDAWLKDNLPAMLDALGPRGLLILTWDEDEGESGNHILTVFAGPAVKKGFTHTATVNHYNVLRTICDALGLTPFAAAASADPLLDVWATPTRVVHVTWGQAKAGFRR